VEALDNYYARKGMKDKQQKLVHDYVTAHGDSFLADQLLAAPATEHTPRLVNDAKQGLAEVFFTMANLFHGVRTPADEIATLRLALYLRPQFPAAQFLLADAYEIGQDYRAAIEAYKSIDPASPYFVRGRIRSVFDESELGHTSESLGKLDALATSSPHDIDALLAKGDILRQQKRYKEAADAYTAAAERIKTPLKQHWIIFFSRGACYERMGQWSRAEDDMKKALSLSPGEPDVLNYLGYSWLIMHHNLAEAKKMIEDAYEARPEDAHIIDSMGYALYVNGDFSSAQEYFEQALERTPNDPTVNDHLGDAYWQMGRKTEARYQWERALADNPDEETKQGLHRKLEKGLVLIRPLSPSAQSKPAQPAPEDE
jgi:tetratricopeptide (TPR) repeat protein